MDLRDLAYFETIAELGHLGRAAQKLNRSQPALTKSIQRLKESFGTRLFQRDGRRIKLTPVGELLQARGKVLQQSIAQTQREVRDFASGAVGNIRVGCASTMAEYLLPKLTSALLQRSPDVTLKMVIGQDDLLRESLRSGQLDMIICSLITDDEQFESFPILKDEAVVIASKDRPIFKAGTAWLTCALIAGCYRQPAFHRANGWIRRSVRSSCRCLWFRSRPIRSRYCPV